MHVLRCEPPQNDQQAYDWLTSLCPLAARTRLGLYEILNPLRSGGMGEVYKARDTRLDRTVVVKILPDDSRMPVVLHFPAGRME
jgi:serine/threonine protein kinase